MSKMVRVSKEEFYKTINPLDVTLTPYPSETLFKLRSSRELVGRTEGYRTEADERFYELSERWLTKANGGDQ